MSGSDPASDTRQDGPSEPQRRDVAERMRLRPDRPQVARLSRRVIAAGAALALVLIGGAVLWALADASRPTADREELYATDHHGLADELTSLPKDYAGSPNDAPRLARPLPGVGSAIAAALSPSSPGALVIDGEQQHLDQEAEAARTSKVFASTGIRPPPAAASSGETPSSVSSDDAFVQNGQDRKLAFVNTPPDRRTTSPDRLVRPASPFVVQAGTVIPAALLTGIRSDLPGLITAQVTENVYDSPTGRARLVPQGARLIGAYDSQVAFGQSRILLVWTRLIMPNGNSIVLERQSGADAAGSSGLEDDVDNHWKELLGAAALSTLLAVGSEAGSGADVNGTNGDAIQALRGGAADSLNQTGQQVVRRNLDVQPTLTIRPGFPVRVIVNRDLVLAPYGG